MNQDQLTQTIQEHFQRLSQAVADLRHQHLHYLAPLESRHTVAQSTQQRAYEAERDQAERHYQQQIDGIDSVLAEEVRAIWQQWHDIHAGYRWAPLGWDDPSWQAYTPDIGVGLPPLLRVGEVQVDDDTDEQQLGNLAALIPIIGQGHLWLECDDSRAGHLFLQNIVLRMTLSASPNTQRLTLFDPVDMGSNLSAFLHLPETIRGPKVYAHPKEIEEQIDVLIEHIEHVLQTRLLNNYPNIEEYNAHIGEIAVPYHFLILNDFPVGLNDRLWPRLLHIAHNGPRAGVYLIAYFDPNHTVPAKLESSLESLRALGNRLRLEPEPVPVLYSGAFMGDHVVGPDTMPPVPQVNQWLSTLRQAIHQDTTSLAFQRIAIPKNERWTESTIYGLDVPIGINSVGEPHIFKLGQGMIHHGLVGGVIGSGKSNMLHVLITQLALRHSPAELELYLIDFKEGVEFQHYLNLPQARVVGLESEREFGLSILRRLHEQMVQRGRTYREAGVLVNDLITYRQQTGHILPRILLIMDEFQVLFGEDDSLTRDAVKILEDIVRRGRAFGIHLLLSSQSPSMAGVYGNRIYNQIGLRIALRCRAQDAQAILGEGNDAASTLEQAGEAIYNDEMGYRARNRFMRVALLPPEERLSYLDEIHHLATTHLVGQEISQPITFSGHTAALLTENTYFQALLDGENRPEHQRIRAWLGEPVEIKGPTAATFERYMRSNLLIAGGNEQQAYGLLLSSLLCLAAQLNPAKTKFYIADFSRPHSSTANFFGQLSLPHPLQIVNLDWATTLLEELTETVQKRIEDGNSDEPDIYFWIAGLHRWRDLRSRDSYTQSDGAKKLLALAEDGPEVGVHLIAWADGFGTLERILKRGGVSLFDLRAILRLPEIDSNHLLGSPVAARLEDNRALFRYEDWEMRRLEKFKPYAVPPADVLQDLVVRIHELWKSE